MRALSTAASVARHAGGAVAEALLVAALVAALLLALSPVYKPADFLAGADRAQAAQKKPTIEVTFGDTTTSSDATASASGGSIFSADGCGFRKSDPYYYMVVHGPAPDTSSLGYWVDPFTVGGDGCGHATVSWSSSGVPGDFDVYVVRSPSGNPWRAQPASNVVTITIVDP